MSRWLEQLLPYAGALAAGAVGWHFCGKFPKGDSILSASITVGAIFTGFMGTSLSIATAINSEAMKHLKETAFWNKLLGYMHEAIWVSLLYCIFCLIGFFLDKEPYPQWVSPAWSFFSAATLLTFFRVTHILLVLMKQP